MRRVLLPAVAASLLFACAHAAAARQAQTRQEAEDQRAKDASVERPTAGHALIEPSFEEGTIAIEPSLRLEKREEEKA